MTVGPEEVLKFWLDDCTPEQWYVQDDALDADITRRFRGAWDNLKAGGYSMWLTYPTGALAYILLADQFPRNMFRGSKDAFALDTAALAVAKRSVDKGWDMRIDEPARQFFYLPMMHSENLCDQERGVRLIHERMPEHGANNLLHARAHREVIRQFGRFPYRNDTLGRSSTGAEQSYLAQGGYGSTVRSLQAEVAA